MRATTVNVVLFIGVVHQRDEEEDFVDIKFITLSENVAVEELKQVKQYARKILKYKCAVERENYILYKSLDEKNMLEAFIVERIIVVRGNE